jgi:hypothetical protein
LRIVDYHELLARRPEAERFVFSPFCHGTGLGQAALAGLLRDGARVFVGTSEDGVKFYGFSVLHRGHIGWLYVKDVHLPGDDGSTWRLRGRGIGKALLAAAGFAKPGPVPMLFDVPAARSAAARFIRSGWVVTFPVPEKESAA